MDRALAPPGGVTPAPGTLPRDPEILLVVGTAWLSQGDTTGARAALAGLLELAGDRYPAEAAWARGVLGAR